MRTIKTIAILFVLAFMPCASGLCLEWWCSPVFCVDTERGTPMEMFYQCDNAAEGTSKIFSATELEAHESALIRPDDYSPFCPYYISRDELERLR